MVTELMSKDLSNPEEFDGRVKVIMFFGQGCGPCAATMPFYETASEFYIERQARIDFYKYNAWESEDNKELCRSMGITGVPHFRAYYKGELLTEKVGGGDLITMKHYIHEAVDEAFKKFGEKI